MKPQWMAAGLGVAWLLITSQSGSAAGQVDTVDPVVATAIDNFQAFWAPPENELEGIRVVIYADGGGAKDAETRTRDDLCLWTATHLYHLVRNAGGFPVLPRPDDRPASRPFEQIPTETEGQVWLRITTGAGQTPSVAAANESDGSKLLAESLSANGLVLKTAEPAGSAAWAVATVILPAADPRDTRSGEVPAHRTWAESVYRGVAAFARRTHPEQVSQQPQTRANPADQPVVPYYPRLAPDIPFRRTAASIWPDGDLPITKAKWFCDLYAKQAFSDRTNIYFDPAVSVQGSTVVIAGATNHTVLQHTLEKALRAAGVKDVRSEMRLLPEQGQLDPDRWFGACVAPMALSFGRPADGAPLQSQLLYGEPVFLLDRQDGFYLLQGGDGYCGWVREHCILTMSRGQFKTYTDRPEVVLLKDIASPAGRIVRGTRLRVVSLDDRPLRAVLPDGRELGIAVSEARIIDDAEANTARAKAALDLLHVPYLYAGRSSVGLDCSGLVGSICDQFGCVLPRDAAQQFVSGSLVATRWFPEGLRMGDRIYFLNEAGKIFHTGLSLGGHHFVHSSPPGVQIGSLREGDRLYREHWDSHFLGARRP